MARNANSHFAVNPTNIDIQRSRFARPSSYKTTFNVGDIIPFYVDADVLPGDTYQIDSSKVVRMQTLLTPMMDNIYLDTYFFFVPHRLVWGHWKEFMGENTQSAWLPEVEYNIPQITAPTGGWNVGSIADYMGIPTGVDGFSVNALPFRAYALVMNEWFRSTALTDPLVIERGDTTVAGVNSGNYITDVAKGGKPFVAAKFFDYFTGALPAPQLGPDVELPLLDTTYLPVITRNMRADTLGPNTDNGNPIAYVKADSSLIENIPSGIEYYKMQMWGNANGQTDTGRPVIVSQDAYDYSTYKRGGVKPSNLWAYNDGSASVATINQLRQAFQIQRYYERLARGGSRYIEMIKSFFNVTSPDARLQRPEYLGGNRIPININQVIQQSATDDSSPLGNTAAMSLTTDSHSDFTHSFTEHGTILGLMVARYDHTYQQGLNRMWSRKTRFDYYFPVFAHLGEQAIKNKEIFLQSDSVIGDTGEPENDEVFGYQEAWAEYRYRPSMVTGEMRSAYAQSLDAWHLADDYSALPALSDAWLREDKSNVDRVLAVTSSVSNQLFCDIYISEKVTRPMPLYSIPGLIDHY